LEEAKARFQIKRGAQFRDEEGRVARFDFGDAFDRRYPYALQVPRDEFDTLLLRHAARLGADVREGWRVTGIRFEGERACGVDVIDAEGRPCSLGARAVVDATGREASIARLRGGTARVPGLANTAFYTQFEGAWRDSGERAGDIVIGVLPRCRGWFWFIPFKDGRTSVGAVMPRAWTLAHQGKAPELFAQALAESSAIRALLPSGARMLLEPEATADFTFRTRAMAGDGWLAVGDAGGFIDPLFSTGAHVAMVGASHAATALDAALTEGDVQASRFGAWAQKIRRGTETFIGVVQAFYEGSLVDYLFAERPRVYIKRAITSMLTGDVFEDSRWVNEMRARYAPVLE
jgi:flavin-dependent dehydrogenase